MKIEVRYFSKSGNTQKLADAIASAVGTTAKVADRTPTESTDLLFVGGAIYAGSIDKNLKAFLEGLTSEKVKEVAVFSSAAGGKSILPQIEELLKGKGILVHSEDFACKGKFLLANRGRPNEQNCAEAAAFAKKLTASHEKEV